MTPADDDAVAQLVEEVLDSGRTPEEVCAEFPHLLSAVRAQCELCRRVAGLLDDVLPPPTGLPPRSAGIVARSTQAARGRAWPAIRSAPGGAGVRAGGTARLRRHGRRLPRARDVRLQRRVALKMILSGQYAGATSAPASSAKRGRSRRCGTRTWCRCTTPASTTAAPTTPWNWSRGGTLAARLARVPLAPAEATALLEPIADAVHAAHEAGIVHGDLKPGNILLGRDGAPKIAEFGLARRTDAGDETITLSGSGPGTPSYMAPEQVTGGPGAVGPAADVYGAGAVLYEVLTGRPPFRGDSAAETARQVLSDEPAPPSRLNGRVPRDLETICLKCLAKEPGRRYASSAALAEDLRRYRRGEPITARRSGRIEPSVKWARRKPATAALVLVLAGGSGGLWLASERAAAARAAAVDVDEANVLQRQGDWDRAAGALARAE